MKEVEMDISENSFKLKVLLLVLTCHLWFTLSENIY